MSLLIQETSEKQADNNTKYHCLYGYYFLKLSRTKLAEIYNKSQRTISRWISRYEEQGTCERKCDKSIENLRKFPEEQRQWIMELYGNSPLLYLSEARNLFIKNFHKEISVSTICRILASYGYTWKVIERRAIQFRNTEVVRYLSELSAIRWILSCLCFLDEVSFDNRGMLRSRGYALKGTHLVHRGEFVRLPRISLLCFLIQEGLAEGFQTTGTFTRLKFFDCCKKFALSGQIQAYPGKGSVWILDGARIHVNKDIIRYLRSIGIIPIFLPPYAPFFNPIELIFGYIKRDLQKFYEGSGN